MANLTLCLIILLPILINAKQIDFVQIEGEYSKVLNFSVDSTKETVILFNNKTSSKTLSHPYRINVWTNKTPDTPVIVVVKQELQVLSWKIPFKTGKDDESLGLLNTSRTLCMDSKSSEKSGEFIVTLASTSEIDVFVKVEKCHDYYITSDKNYSVNVSPSQTQFFFYQFANIKTESIIIEIATESDICLTVSIQQGLCPVFVLNEDVTYEGTYQTVIRKGGLSIRRKDFPNGFFLVFVPKLNYTECTQHSILPLPPIKNNLNNHINLVKFSVLDGPSSDRYFLASLTGTLILLIFLVAIIILNIVFENCERCSNLVQNQNHNYQNLQDENAAPEPEQNELTPEEIIQRPFLTLDMLTKNQEVNIKRGYNYLYHIMSIGLFYGIPVIQLVITYQRIVNGTGDEDLCYYNFLCARPAFGFSDFNHILSNIGYIVVGIIFLLVVFYRSLRLPQNNNNRGVPIQYGYYYGMGLSLILEGVLSGAYHVCPNQSNFQFDTSFMYVMLMLYIVKLYQNRHPDVNPTSYTTFSLLGFAILCAMIGILNGIVIIWILFGLLYFILCIYLSIKVYYVHHLKLGLQKFKESIDENGLFSRVTFTPIKKPQFYAICCANFVNFSVLLFGSAIYNYELTDFATFVLILLLVNAGFYCIFYVVMKLINQERICAEAILYGLLAIITWGFAISYFINNAIVWKESPAESRLWNQPCKWLDFYDTHDIWHLISALALFFSFVFLLCLDDDLINTERSNIRVF